MMVAMEALPPSIDRLAAALRAARRTYTHDGDDQIALGRACLHVLISQLAIEGVPQEELQPLVDIERNIDALKLRAARAERNDVPERRRRNPPSDILLARLSAVIDLLVKGGYGEEEAAQLVTRRMLAAGVPPPQKGGDSRGWKRLLAWRAALNQGVGSPEVKGEYREFSRDIEAIPAAERLKRVLETELWDRRRRPR